MNPAAAAAFPCILGFKPKKLSRFRWAWVAVAGEMVFLLLAMFTPVRFAHTFLSPNVDKKLLWQASEGGLWIPPMA